MTQHNEKNEVWWMFFRSFAPSLLRRFFAAIILFVADCIYRINRLFWRSIHDKNETKNCVRSVLTDACWWLMNVRAEMLWSGTCDHCHKPTPLYVRSCMSYCQHFPFDHLEILGVEKVEPYVPEKTQQHDPLLEMFPGIDAEDEPTLPSIKLPDGIWDETND